MQTVNIHAAKTHLSQLLDSVANGQEVLIARAGKPIARLVPLEGKPAIKKRQLGRLAGVISVPDDFDAPLPEDILNSFEAM